MKLILLEFFKVIAFLHFLNTKVNDVISFDFVASILSFRISPLNQITNKFGGLFWKIWNTQES